MEELADKMTWYVSKDDEYIAQCHGCPTTIVAPDRDSLDTARRRHTCH